MEWLLIILVAGGGGFAAKRWRTHVTSRRDELEQLEGVRRLADEQTRADYQTALDAYEDAKRTVPGIRTTDEISKVIDVLSSGRYALACVQARTAGRAVPELRVPCFFNPQHGTSVTDVMWTQPGHGTRQVPACAQDAARVDNDEAPELRRVRIGTRSVPYWQAGAAFLPYSQGYFAGAAGLAWVFQPAVVVDYGAGGGHPAGGFDGGGFDVGGFDGGGGGE